MGMRKLLKNSLPLCLGFALLAGGCAWTDPYVYDTQEFNRDAAEFGKELEDRTTVSICYNKRTTTPQQVLELAQNECGRFQKVAFFNGQDRLECPLFTPALAKFFCVNRYPEYPAPNPANYDGRSGLPAAGRPAQKDLLRSGRR